MPAESIPDTGTGILVALEVLINDDPLDPRPLDDAVPALERLGWIGRPVVLAGRTLLGRRLPDGPADRSAWVRTVIGRHELDVACFDEPAADRPGDEADRLAVGAWSELRRTWRAEWLLTARPTSVGPARRAGLSVVRIGPRGSAIKESVERADHEARDLLDAVGHLLVGDAFAVDRPG